MSNAPLETHESEEEKSPQLILPAQTIKISDPTQSPEPEDTRPSFDGRFEAMSVNVRIEHEKADDSNINGSESASPESFPAGKFKDNECEI